MKTANTSIYRVNYIPSSVFSLNHSQLNKVFYFNFPNFVVPRVCSELHALSSASRSNCRSRLPLYFVNGHALTTWFKVWCWLQ